MADAKLPQRLPSGKTIRPKLVGAMAKQVGKYAEAEQLVDELKKAAEKKIAERDRKGSA